MLCLSQFMSSFAEAMSEVFNPSTAKHLPADLTLGSPLQHWWSLRPSACACHRISFHIARKRCPGCSVACRDCGSASTRQGKAVAGQGGTALPLTCSAKRATLG